MQFLLQKQRAKSYFQGQILLLSHSKMDVCYVGLKEGRGISMGRTLEHLVSVENI